MKRSVQRAVFSVTGATVLAGMMLLTGAGAAQAAEAIDLPNEGDTGQIATNSVLPTEICFQNSGDQRGMGYVAHVSKTFPVRTYVPVSAGKTECTTKFFGGQTVEVGNYGQTPLRAYKD